MAIETAALKTKLAKAGFKILGLTQLEQHIEETVSYATLPFGNPYGERCTLAKQGERSEANANTPYT